MVIETASDLLNELLLLKESNANFDRLRVRFEVDYTKTSDEQEETVNNLQCSNITHLKANSKSNLLIINIDYEN